jgi:hypothetical protein
MNERIRQITGQVLDELVPETWTRLGYDKIKEIQNRTAELIVRECLEACSRANEIRHFVPPGQQQVVLDCMREIETTFRS